MVKKTYFRAGTIEDARKQISEIPAQGLNDGDEAEVTYFDGSKQTYVFRSEWAREEDEKHVLEPGGVSSRTIPRDAIDFLLGRAGDESS